jgi:hypothetical protein
MPILTSLANRRPTSCKTCYVAGNSPLLSHWRQPAGCCSSINDEDDDLGLSIPPAFCKPPDPALVVSRSKGFHLTTGSSRAGVLSLPYYGCSQCFNGYVIQFRL